ncbi:hypothetical protein E5CHR_04058 [Variovorax sp. PBL-E5]|nr:hypothetical protein E5CHR_04058 [Variovorax sp. PBL-E5]
MPANTLHRPIAPTAIPIAVMGDSNSHSYQDSISFPPGSADRGGALRPNTFQWTEVLARLRGKELDSGPWVRWGRPGVVARGRELLGLNGARAPKKEDYLYNFANSGATCNNLMESRMRQAPRLVELMDQEPERWKRGVVVIRMGLNNWSGLLDLQAHDPKAPGVRAVIDYCAGEIQRTIALIHATHPTTRVLVVGIANETDDPEQFDRYQSASATVNLRIALDDFNAALRQLTVGDPRLAYFDDLAWFERLWGSRTADGKPIYKTVAIGPTLRVTNTAGDDPHNALVGDHHAGLVWNALWAQSLVARLREAFGLPLTPISDDEIRRFVEPLVSNPPKAPGS